MLRPLAPALPDPLAMVTNAAILMVFSAVHPILSAVADVFSSVMAILNTIAHVLAPITHIFPSIPDVFPSIPDILATILPVFPSIAPILPALLQPRVIGHELLKSLRMGCLYVLEPCVHHFAEFLRVFFSETLQPGAPMLLHLLLHPLKRLGIGFFEVLEPLAKLRLALLDGLAKRFGVLFPELMKVFKSVGPVLAAVCHILSPIRPILLTIADVFGAITSTLGALRTLLLRRFSKHDLCRPDTPAHRQSQEPSVHRGALLMSTQLDARGTKRFTSEQQGGAWLLRAGAQTLREPPPV